MEIRLNINGLDVTITAQNAVEAGQIIAQLSAQQTASATTPTPPAMMPASMLVTQQSIASPQQTQTEAVSSSVSTSTALSAAFKQQISNALVTIQGNPSAVVLALLASHPKGMWDTQIKEHLKEKGILTLAPQLSHMSKMFTKVGVDVKALLQRRRRALGKGRYAYHYQLIDGVAPLIQAIPDFETQRGIPRFEDEDGTLAGLGLDDI